ncbi:glycosyltransferase [Flavobacterium weaverense]|uniref:Glycosyl transferase family 1 n=1 Tax=Flavobacterium weaverense TaxID=271156 RepID=A0A3L9ZR51_9FLAO|nr:glycosyltransferase [Flavobacterium weaverense]RMA74836.1 glycosyl transferase family 1 [Flavobacterium weaverense]
MERLVLELSIYLSRVVNMKKVVFMAPFPTPENIKEGMMQRVYAIDKMFGNDEYDKTYIIPRIKALKTKCKQVDENTVEIKLSIWISFLLLLRKLKSADVIYCHSLYGLSLAGFLFLPFLKKKEIVWDVHGIIPEEIKFAKGGDLKFFVYSILERLLISKVTKVIVVTNAMKRHLLKKYNNLESEILVYPILPNTINVEDGFEINDGKLNILYAGNMQGYQNISLMIKSIKKMVNTKNIYFYILTGQRKEMIDNFVQNGLGNKDNIFIDSVNPSDLNEYYRKAHYGFVLRDDIDVNNVACPTKIIEYLAYGITCITLNNKIGDFQELGFNYITLDQLDNEKLKPSKSLKNHQIYSKLYSENKPFKLIDFVLK